MNAPAEAARAPNVYTEGAKNLKFKAKRVAGSKLFMVLEELVMVFLNEPKK